MTQQLIRLFDNDRILNRKVTGMLSELGLLPVSPAERPDFVRSDRQALALLDRALLGIAPSPALVPARGNPHHFARGLNAKFASAYSTVAASANWRTGEYSIRNQFVSFGDWLNILDPRLVLTPGEGLVVDFPGATSASGSGSAAAEAAVFQTLNSPPSCTAVFDVKAQVDGDTVPDYAYIQLGLDEGSGGSFHEWGFFYLEGDAAPNAGISTALHGNTPIPYDYGDLDVASSYRFAISFGFDHMRMSVAGRPTLEVPSPDGPDGHIRASRFYIYLGANNATAGVKATVENLLFLNYEMSATQLEQVSGV